MGTRRFRQVCKSRAWKGQASQTQGHPGTADLHWHRFSRKRPSNCSRCSAGRSCNSKRTMGPGPHSRRRRNSLRNAAVAIRELKSKPTQQEAKYMHYQTLKDFEGIEMGSGKHFRFSCCDCGIVHAVAIVSAEERKHH